MFYDEKADYAGLLPERLREVLEFAALADAVGEQIDILNAKIKRMAQNMVILDSDEEAVARRERIWGAYSPMSRDLQARREALRAGLMTNPPINLKTLKSIIETYMGLEVMITVAGQTVRVKYRGESRISDLLPLYVTIYEAIPANMLLYIVYNYMNFDELDSFAMDFEELDGKKINWETFDKGEWI